MKVALTQMDIVWEDIPANICKGESLIKAACSAKAEIILFPEMSFTGFSMNLSRTAESVCGELDGHELTGTVSEMLRLSEIYSIIIVFGYVRMSNSGSGKGMNGLMAVESGKILAQYDKIHPFTFGEEGKYFTGGSRLAVCQVNHVSFGLFICYDLRFPEIFQASSQRCTVLAVIANWPGERIEQWRILLQARAVENQSFVFGINRTGEGGGHIYVPSTIGFDPWGQEILSWVLSETGDELLLAEIDPSLALQYRSEFPVKDDRKEELYSLLRRL